ncbi:hypothetical protein FRC02_008580 [Tulasnella sp. 418]|nr:hypothetical protein FRC02_008580 [Tulasnella sp. 418]
MTDKVPYAHVATTSAVQMAIVRGDPPLPVDQTPSSHVGPSVGFWGMIRRCWDIDPSRRPTISELLGYIRGIMSKNRLTVDTRDGTVLMPVMLDRTVALTASPQAISTPLNRDRSDSSLWRCPEESRNLPIPRRFPCRLRRRCRPLEAPRSDSVSSPF